MSAHRKMPNASPSDGQTNKVRLDKWLWAARFFKTRNIAKQAIDTGKVRVGGMKTKASREISIGESLTIKQGYDEKHVIVTALSEQRRGATEAALLYNETEESMQRRQLAAEQRRVERASKVYSENRPTKKERRQIHKFKENHIK